MSGAYHVVGATDAGPIGGAVAVRDMGELERTFGARSAVSAVVHDELAVFFAEGGHLAYVTRTTDTTPAGCVAALDTAGPETRGAAVAVPEHPAAAVGAALIDHAARHGKIALLAPAGAADAVSAAADAAALAAGANGDYAGVFWPWVGTTVTPRMVPPTGFVAAARARAHAQVGYWQHPAGERSTTRTISGVAHRVTRQQAWELADELVSAVAITPTGVQLYGWWSLSGDRGNFPHLSSRDLLNNIAVELRTRYDLIAGTTWASVDHTVAQVRGATRAVLAALASRGALTPGGEDLTADPGYVYTVTAHPDLGVIDVDVAVRPLQYARLVGFNVIRVPLRIPLEVTE